MRRIVSGLFFLALLAAPAFVPAARAQDDQRRELDNERPPNLTDIMSYARGPGAQGTTTGTGTPSTGRTSGKSSTPPEVPNAVEAEKDRQVNAEKEMRQNAIKEAALSFGARGGLAQRTWEIRKEMAAREGYLDKIYDFRRLLISAPSGLLIEPPIIGEAEDALKIESQGQLAAVADRVYNISRDARIVTAPRNWRAYLERDWGEVKPPPSILFPRDAEERKIWVEQTTEGWKMGTSQANDIFQADLDRLNADFNGMIRYRMLLAQGMVSQPYALSIDRGVTGGGKEMRVGDRAVQITGPSQLQPESTSWRPANQ